MEKLYRENAAVVYHFLYARCRDKQLAEDLTQETFLQAYRSLDRFDGSCRLSTWLCQIAKHLLYRHWAKTGRADLLPMDETFPAKDNVEQDAMNRMELADVWEAVEQLPEPMGQVVKLRAAAGLTYKEIGQILGKSENWARVTFFRAKEMLRKGVWHEEPDL